VKKLATPDQIKELIKACIDSLNYPERSKPDKPLVCFLAYRNPFQAPGRNPKPVRFVDKRSDGKTLYHFYALDVLVWMKVHGILRVYTLEEDGLVEIMQNCKDEYVQTLATRMIQ
jgi:hypothetical protein